MRGLRQLITYGALRRHFASKAVTDTVRVTRPTPARPRSPADRGWLSGAWGAPSAVRHSA